MQEGEQKMSVKTGGVGISPDIDKLLEMDSKSIEEYAATVMVSAILGRGNAGTVRGGSNTANQKNPTKNTKKNGNEVKRIENITGERRMESEINNVNKKMAREAMIQYGVNPRDRDAAEEFYKSYQKLEAEYLVEGAILTCTQATDKMISVYEKETINTETKEIIPMVIYEGNESDTETPLQNVENSAHDSNDSRYATVSDTKKLHNIFPFRNCKLSNASVSNREKIRANSTACQKYGTCYALMDLCEEWTNTLDSMKYGKPDSDMKSGINMKSHLGCYCGGVIYPIDSGQVEIDEEVLGEEEEGMTISAKYIDFLINYEGGNSGKWQYAQNLGDGVITIAYGVVIKNEKGIYPLGKEKYDELMEKKKNNEPLTKSEAIELTKEYLQKYIKEVNRIADEKGWSLSQNRFDALVDVVWNCGFDALKYKASEYLATGDLNNANVIKQLEKELTETAQFEENGVQVWSKNLVERRTDVIRIAQAGSDAYTRNEFTVKYWNENAYDILLNKGLDSGTIDKYKIQRVDE